MLLTGVDTIRDVILFPTLRPGGGRGEATRRRPSSTSTSQPAKPAPRLRAGSGADPDARPAGSGEPLRTPRRVLAWLTALLGLTSLLPTLPWVHVSLGFGDLLSRTDRSYLLHRLGRCSASG